MADDHAKWLQPTAVSAGLSNASSGDCNTSLALASSGEGVMAAGAECADTTIAATFSLK